MYVFATGATSKGRKPIRPGEMERNFSTIGYAQAFGKIYALVPQSEINLRYLYMTYKCGHVCGTFMYECCSCKKLSWRCSVCEKALEGKV